MTVWTIINCQCGSLPVLITGTGAVVVSWGGLLYYYYILLLFFYQRRSPVVPRCGYRTSYCVPVRVYYFFPFFTTGGADERRDTTTVKNSLMQFVKDNFASCINFHCNYPFFVCVHISTKRNTALICTHFHGAETVCAASIIGAAIYISLINRAASGFAPLMMLLAVSFYIKLCNNNNNILLLSF